MIILQQPEYDMLLVTNLRASVVDCTEMSASFVEEPAAKMNVSDKLKINCMTAHFN